jgi:tripartite-type tricarboxylate transporter receptor subunit TctC
VPQLRNTLLATATMLALAIPQFAAAQDYPSRPVRVVVAFPPGGPTDFVGRLITDKMSALLGQRLYIENRAGANGTVGADNVAKSDPDGYSLFLTTAGAVAMSPHIMESIHMMRCTILRRLPKSSPTRRSLSYGKKWESQRPRNWRRSPNRSPARSPSPRPAPVRRRTLLKSSSPTPPEFNSFTCPTVARRRRLPTFLLVRCRCLPPTLPVLISQIQVGAILPIGAAADKRNEMAPDVPTLAEQGYPNTDASNWYALLAPAKTPPAVIKKLNDAVNAALLDRDVRGKIVKSGAVPVGGTPEALANMSAEYDKWGRLVREHAIKETQ